MAEQQNIFISHYGKDDEQVQSLKARLKEQGYNVRNFSVDSTNHKDGRIPRREVVERLLKMRIKWSSSVICLIGDKTHTREWVDFELDEAYQQGKKIIGIYTHGSMETAELPEKLKKYASNIIGWNSVEKLGELISGENIPVENPDSTVASPLHARTTVKC
ncbi:MAG: TIR domain-containing protein [Chitinophagales bacterium]|nr:TIR domain-containing protein [Chitinophagales bacterium]